MHIKDELAKSFQFPDAFTKSRRNLIIACSISIGLIYVNPTITKVSAFGFDLGIEHVTKLYIALLVAIVYELVTFLLRFIAHTKTESLLNYLDDVHFSQSQTKGLRSVKEIKESSTQNFQAFTNSKEMKFKTITLLLLHYSIELFIPILISICAVSMLLFKIPSNWGG